MADLKSPVPVPGAGEEVAKATQKATDDSQTIRTLQGYLAEAKEARRGGMNPRDEKWSQNLDLYWSRYDFSKKASWQAQEVMPEVPVFVDRFAAALKEALVATPNGFYTVIDPADKEQDMANSVKRMTDVWLSTAGRNQVGQLLPYSAHFEEQMKLGAIMACASVTTWKGDTKHGRVAVESVDPRFVWLDHTNRNLYRIRRVELDRHEIPGLVKAVDGKGQPIFNLEEINRLITGLREEDQRWEEERTGQGVQVLSPRKPITLDEYVATVLDDQGNKIGDRALYVMANESYLVRGPEKNPFTHGKDWVTFAPLVTAPLSPYGRSYMEDFGSIAKTFNELTNMILDAVHVSALKAFAVVPGMLSNPAQLAEGISPNKMFQLEDGYKAQDFIEAIDLGTISPDAFKVWTSMKAELREAASINEIGIGQFAPKGRTSATEISETQQSSSALIRSVAQTVETRFLDPQLDLIWKTGLQHVQPGDEMIRAAAGDQMFSALMTRRKELIARPLTFQARGISTLIARGQMLKSLLNVLGVIAQNDIFLQAFLQKVDITKLINKLFELSNVDLTMLQATEREQAIRSVTEPMQAAQDRVEGAPEASDHTQGQMAGLTQMLGVGR
jgi:hypothetical protein